MAYEDVFILVAFRVMSFALESRAHAAFIRKELGHCFQSGMLKQAAERTAALQMLL